MPQPTGTHPFDQAIALQPLSAGRWQGTTSADYANMIGPFGGITGANLLNGIISHEDCLGQPISLSIHFAAPVADGDFEISARPVRTNRNSQHWLVEMFQHDELVAYGTAVTANRRDTWQATDASFPDVPAAEHLEPSPIPVPVQWPNCYDIRFVDGYPGGPRNDNCPSLTRVWMRDEPPRKLDFLSLTALCDAFFPRLFTRRPGPVAIGTVTMTIYFHANAGQLSDIGSQHLLGVARASHFGKGFFDQSAEMWSGEGELLATTHQLVYFKE